MSVQRSAHFGVTIDELKPGFLGGVQADLDRHVRRLEGGEQPERLERDERWHEALEPGGGREGRRRHAPLERGDLRAGLELHDRLRDARRRQ